MSATRRLQLGAALWGVLIGLGLALAIAACASRAAPTAGMDARKQDIQKLYGEIKTWRKHAGMTPDPDFDLKRDPDIPQSQIPKLRQCASREEPPKTDECTDVCNLKDDICDNAEKICRIADDLGDDQWARNKCNSAKLSCKEATEKCCDCQAGEKAASEEPPVDRSNAHF